MGIYKEEFIIATTLDSKENKKQRRRLDKFVKSHRNWFVKSKVLTNGIINYVMFWEGSKEGWDTSNKGDELRKKFLTLLRKTPFTSIYYINGRERKVEYEESKYLYNL